MSDIRYLDELGLAIEEAARASLMPTKRRPWAGVVAIATAFVLVLAAGAVVWFVRSPEEAAAPTTTLPAPTDAIASPDQWARVPHQDVFAPGSSFSLSRVVHGPGGFLAIGDEGAPEQDAYDGAVLESSDGLTWERLDNGTDLDGLSLQAIALGTDSMVLGGLDPTAVSAQFLSSTDGVAWSVDPLSQSGDVSGAVVHGLAPHGDGFVGVGGGWIGDGPDAVETGVAWLTDAEGVWQEVVVDEFDASALNDVLVVDGVIRVVGLSGIDDDRSEPTVWTSLDDGATWSTTVLPRLESSGFAGASSIAEFDGRWLIGGFEGHTGAIWTSDDGSTWERHTPDTDMFSREGIPTKVHDVLLTDTAAVAVGVESVGTDIRRITWISDDASQWRRLDFVEPTIVDGASPLATSLAADGATIVAVGRELLIDGAGVGAVWVSPPGPGMAALEAVVYAEAEEPDAVAGPGTPGVDGWLRLGIDSSVAQGYEAIDGTQVPPSLNPFLIGDASNIARLVVPGAYRLDPTTGDLTPWLVEGIPRLGDGLEVVEDGTVTVTYTVREAAVWEDGQPVTAQDLAFTHDLITRYANQFEIDTSVHELVDAGTMVVDGKSLTFELTEPNAAYERLFEWVLPSHIIDADTFLDDWNDRLWPSAGPFRFVSWDVPTARFTEPSIVVVERNPLYWETDATTGEPLPHLDGIDVHAFPGGVEPSDAAAMLQAGELDVVMGSLAASWALPSYGNLAEQGLEIRTGLQTLYEVMAFNLTDGRFEANPNSRNDLLAYRRAVLSAIDRRELGATVGVGGVDSITGIAVDRYNNDAWHAFDDASQVDDLLAGVEEPIEAVYMSSFADSTIAVGEAVADQLTAAGIETTTQFDGDFFGTQLPERLLDLYALRVFGGLGGLASVVDALAVYLPQEIVLDWTGLDAEADRFTDLLAQARSEFDQDRQAELLAEAESVLADNALVYPLVLRQSTNAIYWPDRIDGIQPNRINGWDTWNAGFWRSP